MTHLRYAQGSDVSSLKPLIDEVVLAADIYVLASRLADVQKLSAENLAERIAEDPRSIVLAEQSGALVGFAVTTDQHGPIWIDWLGVAQHARGQGVGKALLAYLLAEGPVRRATRYWCDTRTNNNPAIKLFAQFGFSQFAELTRHWHGQDYFLWEKPI